MRACLVLALFWLTGVAAAELPPEARLHRELRFVGPTLPDRWPARNAPSSVLLYADRGTWDTGREHLKLFLAEHGFDYETILAADIRRGDLAASAARLLIVPGGQSWTYLEDLGESGAEAVRRWVRDGKAYAGICAGAFLATSHREGGVATGPYGIGLLVGTAHDGTALGTPGFAEGVLRFFLVEHGLTKGLKSDYRILLLGGPSFRYTAEEAQEERVEVLATFPDKRSPAMISFSYGRGKAFLSGPHLEVEEVRTGWKPPYADPDSEWPLLDRVIHRLLER